MFLASPSRACMLQAGSPRREEPHLKWVSGLRGPELYYGDCQALRDRPQQWSPRLRAWGGALTPRPTAFLWAKDTGRKAPGTYLTRPAVNPHLVLNLLLGSPVAPGPFPSLQPVPSWLATCPW